MKTFYYKFMAFVVTWLLRILPRNPPIVFTGLNSALVMCEQVGLLGFKKVLIVTDNFLGSSGILDGIKEKLSAGGVEYVVYDGVLPDPTFEQVLATRRVQTVVEQLRASDYASLADGADSVGRFDVKWSVVDGNRSKLVTLVTVGPGLSSGGGMPSLTGSVADTFAYRIMQP